MACCNSHNVEQDGLDQDLELLAQDPTLASCCRRDLLDQAKHERLVTKLKGFDTTSSRVTAYRGVFQSRPVGQTETRGMPGHYQQRFFSWTDWQAQDVHAADELQRELLRRHQSSSAATDCDAELDDMGTSFQVGEAV